MDNETQNIREGKTVRVVQKISEGKRERSVPFTGRVMKVRGIGANQSITVRQNLEGIDVERIFPVSSPTISQITVIEEEKKVRKTSGKARRKPIKSSKPAKTPKK